MRKRHKGKPTNQLFFFLIILLIVGYFVYQDTFSANTPTQVNSKQIPLGTSNAVKPADIQGSTPQNSTGTPQSATPIRPEDLKNLNF